MKKQFLILSAVFGLLLVIGAAIIIFNIDQTINNLDELVERYQKERKCTKILISIKKIQQDGFLHHHYNGADLIAMERRITNLDEVVETCTSCHHPAVIRKKIEAFSKRYEAFKQALTTIFDKPNSPRHKSVDLKAFAMGQELYAYAQSLFKKSSSQLAAETRIVRSLTIKILSEVEYLGATYADVVVVQVLDMTVFDEMLKARWNAMKAAMIAGDVDLAVEQFIHGQREVFREIFTALQSHTEQMALEMQDIEFVYQKSTTAEYRIHRDIQHNGQNETVTYYIYFDREGDGLWRIRDF